MPDSPYTPPNANLLSADSTLQSDLPIEGLLQPHHRLGVFTGFFILLIPWFAYDGWLNTDPAMVEHLTFNRIGTGVLVILAIACWNLVARVKTSVSERCSSAGALVFLSPDATSIRVATVPWLWALQFGGLNLLFHKRPYLAIGLWLLGQITLGLATFVLAFLIGGIVRRSYADAGWRELVR